MATRTASRPYVDYDYWNKLSESEKEWLTTFTREYYGNSHADVIGIHSKRKKVKRELSANNNSRRRTYPLQLGQRLSPANEPRSSNPEDAYIDYLDHVKNKKP